MDERKLYNGMTVITILVLFALVALSLLASCKTREIVRTETVTVHDTLRTYNTDTLVDVRVITLHDTVRQVEKHTVTLNSQGDTIREIHHYHDTEKVIVVDSTNRYKAKVDSLQSVIDRNSEKQVVRQKKSLTWRETISIIISFIALTLADIVIIKWAMKDKNQK